LRDGLDLARGWQHSNAAGGGEGSPIIDELQKLAPCVEGSGSLAIYRNPARCVAAYLTAEPPAPFGSNEASVNARTETWSSWLSQFMQTEQQLRYRNPSNFFQNSRNSR